MAWALMTWTPCVKQLTEADSAKRPLWPGGVMMREPLEIESSYRLANGTRKIYTTTTGWHPWRWTWSFDKMPFFYVNQLWTMRDWNKGTSSLTPSAIHLYPMIKEIGTEDLNTSAVPVDIESLSARRVMAPRGQLIGYAGTAVFVSAVNNESVGGFLSTMEGGEPLTDDMPI